MRIRNHSLPYIMLATSFIMSPFPAHGATPVNSVNDGQVIQGGTYYNTSDGVTKFINSGSGGLWLKSGVTVNGKEVDASGAVTGGGSLHLQAPNQVVRLDGNIDVNGIISQQGIPTGDGGKVQIDAGYLYQNGNIYANGYRGGIVQINTGGMTLGQGAQIQAKGRITDDFAQGGVIAIKSSGPVDLRRFSSIENEGDVYQGANFISIEGGLINVDGLVKANSAYNQGGTIRLISTGQSDLQNLKTVLQNGTQTPPGSQAPPTLSAEERNFILQRASHQIQNHDGDVVIGRDLQHANPTYIGQLNANGVTLASPPSPPDEISGGSGSIIVNARHDVVNQGLIIANGAKGSAQGATFGNLDNFGYGKGLSGGNGGTISLIALNSIYNQGGRIEANGGDGNINAQETSGFASISGRGIVGGHGGKGGVIAFGYGQMNNTGSINAKGGLGGPGSILRGGGGKGGLIVLSGDSNPVGRGLINVSGGVGGAGETNYGGLSGTIVSPNPTLLGQEQNYLQQGYVNGRLVSNPATEQTLETEVLLDNNRRIIGDSLGINHSTLIALTKNGRQAYPDLFSRLYTATYRSVDNPTGFQSDILAGTYRSSFINVVIGSSQNNLTLDLNTNRGSQDSALGSLGSLNIVNNGPVTLPSSTSGDFWLGSPLLGDRVSILTPGGVVNAQGP